MARKPRGHRAPGGPDWRGTPGPAASSGLSGRPLLQGTRVGLCCSGRDTTLLPCITVRGCSAPTKNFQVKHLCHVREKMASSSLQMQSYPWARRWQSQCISLC